MFWEFIAAGAVGALIGGLLTYLFVTQEREGASLPSVGDITPFEGNVIRMVRALIDEWNTHKKKRSGLVGRDGETEFILTIRRPLEEKKEEPVYVPEPITEVVPE